MTPRTPLRAATPPRAGAVRRAVSSAGRAVSCTLRRGLAALAGAAVVTGCTLSPAAPSISGVTPEWGYNGEPTEIEIEGAHFFPTVIVGGEVGGAVDGGRIEGTFQAWLVGEDETYALDGVQHRSYERIGAEVPEGLPVGTYGLRVEVPSGLVASFPDVFAVTDTRADHLALSVETAAYMVGAFAPVTIRLQDPEDQTVAQGMEVRLVASSPTSAAGVTFYAEGGLEDQQPLDSAVGVTGRLGDDGTGIVLVSSDAADDVTIEVYPVEPDAVVRGDQLVLSWNAGPVAEVELALPETGFQARAGEPFALTVRLKDALGNVLTNEPADLILFDECGGWVRPLSLVGEGTLEVDLTKVCDEDRIHAYTYGVDWHSEPFAIFPGEHAGYDVAAVPAVVVAGDDLVVFVEAIDSWGNVVTTHGSTVALYDDLGGLDPGMGRGEQSCPGFTSGAQVCTANVWVAGPAVVVRADDAEGRAGSAAAIEVLPDDPVTVLLDVDATTVAAAERFIVTVRVLDRFGNSVGFDPAGTDPVVFLDDSGTIYCNWIGAFAGAQRFSCYIEGAVPDARIEARVLGLAGSAVDPLVVTNADLYEVEVDPQGATFVAGAAFTVELRGFDAYGNPYVVQSDPVVDLSDTAGTMVPATAVLGPAGVVQVSSVVYGAGTAVRVYASQAGVRLGGSRPLLVSPDEQDALSVAAPRWVSVDADASVEITAVDAYGNAITDYAGTVTLSSVGGACDTVVVDSFYAGVATVDLPCATPQLSEALLAVDTVGYIGTSDVMDVVELDCPDGPTAALTLDGDNDTVRCLADGGTVTVDADSSGSFGGGSGITVRHYSDGEAAAERTPSDTVTFTYDATGTRYVELLVADTRACADLGGGYVYLGRDDGEPTGPVTVTTSASSVASVGSLTVDVSALDCTSDLAAGQELIVRADLGAPEGASTGAGLAVTLDATGAAHVDWIFDAGHTGTATFYAGSAGGGAIGGRSVTVDDDRVLPTVVEVKPVGTELGPIPTISLTFSEPMLATGATSTNLALTGPSGAVAATYAWSSDLTTLAITPTTPLDGASGIYTLVVSKSLRDLAGNQLDGEWTGVRASAIFLFGALGESLPEISSCSASVDEFTPDGDDGDDSEADAVVLTPTATGSPAWWWLSVYARDGTRERSLRVPGTDPSMSWDGRGNDGILRDAGPYRLTVAPIDTNGNVGGQCDVSVELQQHVELP